MLTVSWVVRVRKGNGGVIEQISFMEKLL